MIVHIYIYSTLFCIYELFFIHLSDFIIHFLYPIKMSSTSLTLPFIYQDRVLLLVTDGNYSSYPIQSSLITCIEHFFSIRITHIIQNISNENSIVYALNLPSNQLYFDNKLSTFYITGFANRTNILNTPNAISPILNIEQIQPNSGYSNQNISIPSRRNEGDQHAPSPNSNTTQTQSHIDGMTFYFSYPLRQQQHEMTNSFRNRIRQLIECLPQSSYVSPSDNETNEQTECSICMETFETDDSICELPICHHTFHHRCIQQYIQQFQPSETNQTPTCPYCRHDLFQMFQLSVDSNHMTNIQSNLISSTSDSHGSGSDIFRRILERLENL